MPLAEIEPATPASEVPHAHALYFTDTGIDTRFEPAIPAIKRLQSNASDRADNGNTFL
jgi:hypothetical protein